MITAISKRYKSTGSNTYEESANGMTCGYEWTDEFGNAHRFLFLRCPSFSSEAEYAEMLYAKFIKPVGIEDWIFQKEILDIIGKDKYFNSAFPTAIFGSREYEPFDEEGNLKSGIDNQIQFFADNFIFNIHGIPMSFKMFIDPFVKSTFNVEL